MRFYSSLMQSPVPAPRRFAPALILLIASFASLAALQFRPDPAVGAMAAIFVPGTSGREALLRVAAAGGEAVRMGKVGFVIVARPQPGESFATLRQRLDVEGALLVVNPLALAGCLAEGTAGTRPAT